MFALTYTVKWLTYTTSREHLRVRPSSIFVTCNVGIRQSEVDMPRLQIVAARALVAALGAVLVLSTPALAQRSDRGVIGGGVTYAQGAALPGATVTVKNEATGVETVLTTNHAGAYTTAPLVLGPYSVTVNLESFKKSVTSGIQ